MRITFNRKQSAFSVLVLLLLPLLLTIDGCKKKRSEMGQIMFKHTHNPVFKDVDPDEFTAVFEKLLKRNRENISNPDFVNKYYADNDYEPVFVLDHLSDGDISTMVRWFRKADQHGLDPKMFKPDEIEALAAKFSTSKGIKTKEEAYHDMAKLEMLAANSLLTYSNDLEFGLVPPRRIYARYYLKTLRPDSTSMGRIFNIDNMNAYLDSIQPKDPEYLAMQKAYLEGYDAPKLSKEETKRILLVNMERLRWKNKPTEKRYVYVNIPDYHLDVIDDGKAILSMKVCVGEGRNKKYLNSLENYNDTCKIDNPFAHETPLLNSTIHSVQVNPIWNIPHSIATKEIIVEAAKDRFYLSNKNINVYDEQTGKLIKDPETIDWTKINKNNCPYEF